MDSKVFSWQKVMFAGIITVIFSAAQLFSYSFSAWTSMTGAKTLAVSPFFYFSPIGSSGEDMDISMDAVVGYGVSDKADVFLNLASLNLKSEPGSYGSSWIMPRYDFGNSNIGALQIGVTQDANNDLKTFFGPHYHFFWENDKLAFELNALWLSKNNPLSSNGDAYAFGCISPVYKAIPKKLYPYIEVDPSYDFGDGLGFDFTLAPGLWVGIPDTPHQFSISVPIGGIKDSDVNFGIYAWYWWSFSFGGKEE